MTTVHTLVREPRLPGRPEDVFGFFAAAEKSVGAGAPPAPRFVDRQLRGPYALWHHARALVRRDLAAIFDHRFTAVQALIAPPGSRRDETGPESPPPPRAGRS